MAREPVSRSKGCEFESRQERRENFLLQSRLCVLTLLLGVRSTPVLPQWHVKDPGHSAKSAGGRLHLKTHTPLTQRSRSGLTMLLSRHRVGTSLEAHSHANSSGNTRSQSSQLAEPLWTDPGLKCVISVHELIFTKNKQKIPPQNKQTNKQNKTNKQKTRRRGMNCRTFSQNPRTRGKSQQQQQQQQQHNKTELEWVDFAVRAWCRNPSGNRAHEQLVRERSSTVASGALDQPIFQTVHFTNHKVPGFIDEDDDLSLTPRKTTNQKTLGRGIRM